MAHEQAMGSCAGCGAPTMHIQQKPNHVLHLLLSIFTLGLWIPIWVLVGLFPGKPQCGTCATEPSVFGVVFLFSLVLIGALGYVVIVGPVTQDPVETGASSGIAGPGTVVPGEAEPLPSALPGQEGPVLITFLDVGQGDAILVQSPEGQTALIDSGRGVDRPPIVVPPYCVSPTAS